MDYKEFYKISEKIIEKFPGKEIAYRTAISRTYYFAFHHIRENKKKNRFNIHFKNGPGDHQRVRKLLEKVNIDLSTLYMQLHERRKIADYEMEQTIGQQEWQNHLKELETLIEKLDELGFIKRR